MKPTIFLTACISVVAAIAVDSPAADTAAAAVPGELAPGGQEISIKSNAFGTETWCGGYTQRQCSAACNRLGYRCYFCEQNYCVCRSEGC